MRRRQFQIIIAVILRIIRTRFFGHGLGFLLSIAWPLVHILFLLLVNAMIDRGAPYGDSLALFFASGLVPFMTFSYMSRFIMISVVHNRPLLAFPAVKISDLLFAGAVLESLSSCCMVIALAVVLAAFGIDCTPRDPIQAAYALATSMLLGFAVGIVNAVLALAAPTWVTGYALLTVLLYIISGVFFVSEALPESVRYYLAFNPSFQTVEWMRSAYYDSYSSTLDKGYTLAFCIVVLFLGLLIERTFRGRLLIAG